jgi:hypothetical protein
VTTSIFKPLLPSSLGQDWPGTIPRGLQAVLASHRPGEYRVHMQLHVYVGFNTELESFESVYVIGTFCSFKIPLFPVISFIYRHIHSHTHARSHVHALTHVHAQSYSHMYTHTYTLTHTQACIHTSSNYSLK